jgi:beta-lactamase superfamily II metal-dependent hydrolase
MLRPACVLVLREGAQWAGIRWKKAAPLGCALLLDGVVGGYRVFVEHQDFQSGRWIYALAVGGGLMWNQSLGRSHLGLALGSWALVAVWEAWETGWVALATPLLSWVTLPWVCGVVYPGTVLSLWLQDLGFSDLAQGLLRLFAGSLSFCILRLSECTVYSGEFWPGTLWRVSRGAVVVAVILASLMFFISHRLINRIKWGGLLAVGMLGVRVGLAGFVHDQGDTVADRVVQLDVGQGDSALVLGAKPGLIDVGSEHALKDEDWLSVFAFWGVSRLDWIGLTHLDEDHAGSLVRLSRLIRIGCVASSAAEVSSDRGQVLKAALAAQGVTLESWEEGCVPFSVLGPVPGVSRHAKGGNQQMSALWIPLRAGGFYLSAGDADRESELRIGNWASRLADAHVSRLPGADDVRGRRILKISHHGSRYSTSADWLKKIHPSEVWISVGQGNRYGHPSVQTLDLLKHFDVKVRRTDQSGSLD